jgi:hypothetical protein
MRTCTDCNGLGYKTLSGFTSLTIADYEGAYNSIIGVARTALAPQEPTP